jgi:alpha-beta hydrolase superfamily lysophospholipase
VFDELRTWAGESRRAAHTFDRYNTDSPTWPGAFATDWNRTFVLEPAQPRGGALLLHGLSDSPYSMRSLGEILAGEGFLVVGLRIPGHGTTPGALTTVDWRDWRHAVRLAATSLRARLGADAPLVLGGYSNGAALALDHTLAALDDDALPPVAALIFVSPALTVTRMAALARWQLWLSRVPGLDKLAWNALLPEYDPYKYNSFALNAGWQIHRLTVALEERLARLERDGRLAELPPVLTFTSVADATVPPLASLRRLYARVARADSEIVLFDVNRNARLESFLAADADALLATAHEPVPFPFAVTVLGNRDHTVALVARHRAAGTTAWTETPLGLDWPPGIYSLSHVALPFPPDDPIYGAPDQQSATRPDPYPFGGLEARGERGGLVVPIAHLMRMRYNPFFPYLETRVREFVAPL